MAGAYANLAEHYGFPTNGDLFLTQVAFEAGIAQAKLGDKAGIGGMLAAGAIIGLTEGMRGGEAAKEAGVVANGIRGRASEARVLQELGLTKNTTAVSTAEGRSIPDALTKSLSVEVKDAANVSLTSSEFRLKLQERRDANRY